MADLQRAHRSDTPPCRRCGAGIHEVASVAPVGHEPGLTAYECPNCGNVTSELVPAERVNR